MCNVEKLVKATEKSNSNMNFGFVTLEGDRLCSHCGSVILKGTDCIRTFRKGIDKSKKTTYTCDECYELQWGIVKAKKTLERVSRIDKYMAMACQDILSEAIEEYESRCM